MKTIKYDYVTVYISGGEEFVCDIDSGDGLTRLSANDAKELADCILKAVSCYEEQGLKDCNEK
jgi:hypothetical protein